jgi:hypothetical protein
MSDLTNSRAENSPSPTPSQPVEFEYGLWNKYLDDSDYRPYPAETGLILPV